MALHNELGKWGEEIAREYLLSQGYAIGATNTRYGKVEVDFIAFKDDIVVFVEVKTRANDFTDPLDAVDRRKRSRMVRAADAYLRNNNLSLDYRFDLILVIGTPDTGHTLEHIPDAFFPELA